MAKLTKADYEKAAKNLNKVLKLDPAINVTGKKATVPYFITEITGTVADLLTPEDNVSKATLVVIKAMGLTISSATAGEADPPAITTEGLTAAVTDINTILELDPPIPTDDDDQMRKDILEIATDSEGLTPEDKISAESRAIIALLMPAEETKPPAATGGKGETDKQKEKRIAKEAKAKDKADKAAAKAAKAAAKKEDAGPTRIAAAVHTLRDDKPATVKDFVTQANAHYATVGGKDNHKMSASAIRRVVATLVEVGLIEVEGGKITKNDL